MQLHTGGVVLTLKASLAWYCLSSSSWHIWCVAIIRWCTLALITKPRVVNIIAGMPDAIQVIKSYLALCIGVPDAASFTVDAPIGRHPDVKVARCVVTDGQPAITDFQVCLFAFLCCTCLALLCAA